MLRAHREQTFSTIFFLAMAGVSLLAVVVLGLAWTVNRYFEYQAESDRIRSQYTEERKALVRVQVENALDYIAFARAEGERDIKADLAGRVDEAHDVALALYRRNRDKLSEADLKTLIRETLRPLRFNEGRGYFFITALDGVEILFPDRPELEGQNLLDLRSEDGRRVIRDMIAVVRESGRGFYEYAWSKPGAEGLGHMKIAAIRLFEPYGWIVGAGEYVEEVTAETQRKVIEWLSKVRFEDEGYLFGSVLDGSPLFTNGRVTAGGPSIAGLTDPNGVRIFEAHRQAALEPDGGYARYAWPKLTGAAPTPKIAFIRSFPDWNWIIGAGVYLDEVESGWRSLQGAPRREMLAALFRMALLLAVLTAGVLVVAKLLSRRLAGDMAVFSDFFVRVGAGGGQIDISRLRFPEFKRLAESANEMSRKRAEAKAALRDSERRLADIIEFLPDATLVIDAGGTITAWNRAMEAMTGVAATDMLGRGDFAHALPLYGHRRPLLIDIALAGEIPPNHDYTFLERRGRVIQAESLIPSLRGRPTHLLATASAIFDADGRIVGAIESIRDVTAAKQAEAALREAKEAAEAANRAKSEFLATMSHEIRTPLNGIMGMLQLARNATLPPGAREYVDTALGASRSLLRILSDILDISRIEAGTLGIVTERFSLAEVVRTVADAFADEAGRKGLAFHRRIDPDLPPWLLGDAGRLRQVLFNLIGNAVKFTAKGHVGLDVSLLPLCPRPDGTCLYVVVEDTGIGMSDEVVGHVFDLFTQVEGDLSRTYGGAGLGLAIVKRLVTLMGGSVAVEAEAGRGCRFHLMLPFGRADAPADAFGTPRARPARTPRPAGAGQARLLVVEDEEVNLMTMSLFLSRRGYAVEVARNGQEALDALCREHFDGVLMDVRMPVMDGVEATRRIRMTAGAGWDPAVPIIGVTAHGMVGDREAFLAAGMDDCVVKPVDLEELARTVARVLARPNPAGAPAGPGVDSDASVAGDGAGQGIG